MNNYEFVNGGLELLIYVKPLWEGLNKHHGNRSMYFKKRFEKFTFEDRINKFLNTDNLTTHIDLIKDIKKDIYIGYCISTITNDLVGEIESLYLEKDYRKCGLGDELMTKGVDWLNRNGAKCKSIVVAEGNDSVLNFYKKHNFYKKYIILEEIK